MRAFMITEARRVVVASAHIQTGVDRKKLVEIFSDRREEQCGDHQKPRGYSLQTN